MPLYEYVCREGHVTELLRPRDVAVVSCACGAAASREAVNHIGVTGFATVPRDQRNYRQNYGEYREAVAEVADHYETKQKRGDPAREPDYYSHAVTQARAKGARINGSR